MENKPATVQRNGRNRKNFIIDREKKQFHDILDALPIYIILITSDYHISFANKFFKERFGESGTQRCFEYLFGRQAPCENCETFKALKTLKTHRWEWKGPDGHHYDIIDLPFKDVDGSDLILEMGIDITQKIMGEKELEKYRNKLEEMIEERTLLLKRSNENLKQEIKRQDKTQKELRESEKRFKLLFKWLPLSTVVFKKIGNDFIIEDCNEASQKFTKGKMGQFIGKKAKDIYSPYPEILQKMNYAFKNKTVQKYSAPYKTLSTSKNIFLKLTIAYTPPDKIIMHSEDISERIKIEQELANERNNLQMIFDTVDVGMLLIDESGRVRRVNNVLAKWLGKNPASFADEQLGNALGCINSFKNKGCGYNKNCLLCPIRGILKSALNKEKSIHGVETLSTILIDGKWNKLWFDISADPIIINGAKHIVLAMKNITERKKTEEALAASEERIRKMAESVDEVFWISTPDRKKALFISSKYEEIFGEPIENIYKDSMSFARLIHPEDLEEVKKAWGKINSENYNIVCRIIRPDGQVRWINNRVFSMRDNKGNIINIVGIAKDITEQKKSEEALKKSEYSLKNAEALAHLGSWEFDISENLLSWSDEVYRIFGLKPQEFGATREALLKYIHEDDRQTADQAHKNSIKNRNDGYEIKYRIIRNDTKEIRHVSEKCHNIKDSSGKIIKSFGMIYDITDQKKAEEKIFMQNKILQAISETNNTALHAKKEPAFLKKVCQILVKDCGYHMAWIGFAQNDDKKSVHPVAEAGFETGYLKNLNISWSDKTERGRGPTGRAIRMGEAILCQNMVSDPTFEPWRKEALKRGYLSSAVFPLINGNTVLGAINIYSKQANSFSENEILLLKKLASDITYGINFLRSRQSHKEAEKALSKSEHRYRSLFNKMNEGYALHEIILDKSKKPVDYKFLDVNPTFEKLTGLGKENIIGKTVKEILPGTEPEWIQNYGNVALTGRPMHFERFHRELNKYYEVFAYSPVKNQFAVIFLDVTERRRIEEEKNNFISIMSHELRNPLTPILASSQYINSFKNFNNKEIKESVEIIERQSKNMARLLDDLLDISKLSREKITLNKKSLDARQIIRNAVQTALPIIKGQEQDLSVLIPNKPLVMIADPVRLEQIIVNLLNNAAKYTKPKGRIWIKAQKNKGKIEIKVKDNGVGMDPKKIEKIFELFNKSAHPFIASASGSLGIGLNITKHLVTMHQGTICAQSPGKNKGSEFILKFPAAIEKKVKTRKIIKINKNKDATGSDFKILVVDDNKDIANLMSKILTHAGYKTMLAYDGADAIKASKNFRPSAALIDIGLPGINGYDVAQQLRKQNGAGQKLKLIAVTGYGQDKDKEKAKKSGFDYHITKPVDINSLMKIIKEN